MSFQACLHAYILKWLAINHLVNQQNIFLDIFLLINKDNFQSKISKKLFMNVSLCSYNPLSNNGNMNQLVHWWNPSCSSNRWISCWLQPPYPRWFWQTCSRQCSLGWLMVWGFLVVSCWVAGSVGRGEGGLLLKKASWGTNLSLFCVSLQREQQDKAAEMGHRFPGRAGRLPHWSLMPMELLQAANTLPEITTTNTTTKKPPTRHPCNTYNKKNCRATLACRVFTPGIYKEDSI